MSIFSQLFLPQSCCICGEILENDIFFKYKENKIKSPFCASCTVRLEKSFRCCTRKISGINAHAVYLFSYNYETVEKAIFHIKSSDCYASTNFFAQLSAAVLNDIKGNKKACLTHIPRSRLLFGKYGFDQSENVCRTLVRYCNNIDYQKIFERDSRFQTPQRNLNRQERLINARNSLKLFNREVPDEVFVLDDMITTGATAIASYELLARQGCGKISFLFLAGKEKITERRKEK